MSACIIHSYDRNRDDETCTSNAPTRTLERFPSKKRLQVQSNSISRRFWQHNSNELQLQSLKKPRLVGNAPVIALTRARPGETTEFARALARSFARARMKTLFIDADIGKPASDPSQAGWRDLLTGATVQPLRDADTDGLWELPAGTEGLLDDRTVSAPMVRAAIEKISKSFDVVIVSAGSIQDRLSAQFILSNADVGVLALNPSDKKADVFGQIDRLHSLPRNGSVAAMRNALSSDPWLAVRT